MFIMRVCSREKILIPQARDPNYAIDVNKKLSIRLVINFIYETFIIFSVYSMSKPRVDKTRVR